MKTKHIFWGVLFITLGGFIMVDRLYDLTFTWDGVWKLWPIVLILWGIGFIINKPAAKMIVSGLAAFFLAFALFASFQYGHMVIGKGFYFTTDEYDDNDSTFSQDNYKVGLTQNIKKADFVFHAGAGSFVIKDTTADLFSAETQGRLSGYDLTSDESGDKSNINFEMRETKIHFGENKIRNRVEMKFNPEIEYSLRFDIGAASADFDLSPYKISDVHINTGAASLNVMLGNKSELTTLNLDAGAATVNITIPEGAACEINSKMALSSEHFAGFIKKSNNHFRTDNFEGAKNKIILNLDGGISSINVNRIPVSKW